MSQFQGGMDARMPNYQTSLLDETWVIRAGRRDFSHRRRGESAFGARGRFYTLWPQSGMMSGDRSSGYCLFGMDCADTDWWSPPQRAGRGNGATKFIMGQCLDESSVAVSGAIVQGFLTATDAFVAEIACDASGLYELPTPNPGAAHYLVAYRAGAPDIAGTTVNTLTPTNRDGT